MSKKKKMTKPEPPFIGQEGRESQAKGVLKDRKTSFFQVKISFISSSPVLTAPANAMLGTAEAKHFEQAKTPQIFGLGG